MLQDFRTETQGNEFRMVKKFRILSQPFVYSDEPIITVLFLFFRVKARCLVLFKLALIYKRIVLFPCHFTLLTPS
jgi:hypothetical protein